MSSAYTMPLVDVPARTDSVLDLDQPPARAHLQAVPSLAPLDFAEVFRRLTPRLQRYATRRLGDRHEAEELVQEALLRAYRHRAELPTEDDVAAWTTCVTGRLVIDRLRVRGRSTYVAEVPEGVRVGRDTADVVVARDEARLALDALDAMAPRQAAVLWSREVEGLAYDEIGLRFGMTEPAVRSVLSRARKALRKEFATRGGTLPAAGLVALAPWVDSLSWLDRLRRSVTQAAAPATLGLAGLGLLGALVPVPWSGPASEPPSRSAVLVTNAPASPVQQLTGAAQTPVGTALPVATAAVAEPPPAAPAPAPTTVLSDTGLNDTCASAGGASVGGAGCTPAPEQPAAYLDLPLPDNPAGIAYLGVESEEIACAALAAAVPLLACTQGASR